MAPKTLREMAAEAHASRLLEQQRRDADNRMRQRVEAACALYKVLRIEVPEHHLQQWGTSDHCFVDRDGLRLVAWRKWEIHGSDGCWAPRVAVVRFSDNELLEFTSFADLGRLIELNGDLLKVPPRGCPSLLAAGREDRCGLFSFPPRCTPDVCSQARGA